MTYAQKDYEELEGTNSSLIVAFANLLHRFGENINPVELARALDQNDGAIDWLSLAEHYDWLKIEAAGTAGTDWPNTSNSIVLFRVSDHGAKVDHYCLADDAINETIIDSHDGKRKSAVIYGRPYAWVSYMKAGTEAIPERVLGPRDYLVGVDETAWSIAKKLKITGEELLEHNDMRPGEVQPGVILRLPVSLDPATESDRTKIYYEVYDEPKDMHVSEPGGTRKFSFGNVKKWSDIRFSGPFLTQNTNVQIVAEAHVPVGDKEVAKYYMQSHAFGKYRETGLVAHTVGFSHKHLTEGKYIKPSPTPQNITPVIDPVPLNTASISPRPTPIKIVESPTLSPVLDPITEQDAFQAPKISEGDLAVAVKDAQQGTSYRATFNTFEGGDKRYRSKAYVVVHDAERRHPSRPMKPDQTVTLAGTFWVNGIEYGRSRNSVKNGEWFQVPIGNLINIDDDDDDPIYDVSALQNMTLAEKRAYKRELTLVERGLAVWFNTLSQYVRLKMAADKLLKTKTRNKK